MEKICTYLSARLNVPNCDLAQSHQTVQGKIPLTYYC